MMQEKTEKIVPIARLSFLRSYDPAGSSAAFCMFLHVSACFCMFSSLARSLATSLLATNATNVVAIVIGKNGEFSQASRLFVSCLVLEARDHIYRSQLLFTLHLLSSVSSINPSSSS
jgi:hypothetical protein